MKIPKKLKIGAHLVTIDCSKELKGRDGEWDPAKNVISICKTLPESQAGVTFVHELLHALNSQWTEFHFGHMAMESLSQQLYQVLSDNKLLK